MFTAPTSVNPSGGIIHPGSGTTNVPAGIAGATQVTFGQLQTAVQTTSITLPASLAGTTFRLIFSWKNDGGGGSQPPAQIDNIALVSSTAPAQYTWIATTGSAAWNTAGSWSPSRTIPFATDVLNFSNGGSSIVTVPSGAVGGNVVFAGNTSANFQASATNTLTLSSLDIPSGNNLFLNGTDAFAQTLAFSAGAVNTIGGRLEVVNTSGANRLNFTNSVTTVGSTGFLAAGSTVTTAVFTSTATNLLINGTYEHKYTTAAGTIPTATWNAASNCNIVGYTSNTNAPGGIAQTFGNFTWNCTSQTGNLSLTSSSTTGVVGTFRITSTGTGQCRWTATGGYTVNANNFTQTGGIFDLSTGASGNGMSFNVSGTFSQTGGTFRSTGTSTNNPTLHFNGTVAQTVGFATQPTGPITYRISNPNGIVLTGPSANFTIGNATLGSLRISTNSANPITFGGSTNALSYDATNTTLTYDFAGNTTARAIEFPATNGPASLTVAVGAGNVLTVPFSRTVRNTLTMTSGDIDISSNALTLGTAATNATTAGTLTWTSGNIRTTSGSFTRWFTTSGLPTSAGTGIGFFPLASSSNNRNVSLFFTNSTALTTGGTITASHSNIGGLETITPFTDANVSVDTRTRSFWSFTSSGVVASGTINLRLTGGGSFNTPTVANLRLIQASSAAGTSGNGTGTSPNFQANRTALSLANLTSAPHFIGSNAGNIQRVFNSAATGNWNVATTWDVNEVPGCNDVINILSGHTVTVNSAGNNSRNLTINSGGTLLVSSGDLTVGCTNNNTPLTNNGTLTVSGGTLNINGNYNGNAGSTLNQSGGDIIVNGNNNGGASNSVATGTSLVRIVASAAVNLNLTGGTLTIVNPHVGASTTSDLALSVSQGGAANAASANHTVRFGNGISTVGGGHANGMAINLFVGGFYYSLGNVTVDMLTGTNRLVRNNTFLGIAGNLTINSGEFLINTNIIVAGNIVNNGTLTAPSLLVMAQFSPPSSILPSTNAQSISGSGTFQNLVTGATANLTSLQVSNTNASGVTLDVPLSVSGTLTLTNGIINTTNTNLLTLGTTSVSGTLTGGSATAYINGPFVRTIANANANSNYILFPVGKGTTYAPISLAPLTTSISQFRAETFSANTGTANPSIIDLASGRRWEASLVSGSFTNTNVRLNDASIIATSIPVQAPAADGEYSSVFGAFATAVAGVSTQSNNPIASADFTGFLSYARANACSGTPTPGNTLTSNPSICAGSSVTLSLQNFTGGTGVTYQWQSSADDITYNDIPSATNATLSIAPTAVTYYRCNVTCAAGPSTGTSTPIQITFANSITATVPGERCGPGSVALSATPNSGASVAWFANATGGTSLATGETFNTPVISTNTTYFAEARVVTPVVANLGSGTAAINTAGITPFTSGWEGSRIQYLIRASELNSLGYLGGNFNSMAFDVSVAGTYTQSNYTVRIGTTSLTALPTSSFSVLSNPVTVFGPAEKTAPAVGWEVLSFNTPYNWDGISNIIIEICHDNDSPADACFDCYGTSSTVRTSTTAFNSVFGRYADDNTLCGTNNGTAVSSSFTSRPNIQFDGESVCASPRQSVLATVTTPPTFTLSSDPAPICVGETSSAVTVTSDASLFNTFTWSPATGVSGNETIGWVFNPTTTTIYTLTASQTSGSLCSAVANVTVTVNPTPSPVIISNADATICADAIQTLTVSGGIGTPLTVDSGVIAVAIPDNNLATGLTNSLVVAGIPGAAQITGVSVGLSTTHTFNGDLRINLEGPNGQIINLVNQAGGGGDNFSNLIITSDITAATLPTIATNNLTGTFRASLANQSTIATTPAVSSTDFSSLFTTPNGTWRLRVYDDANQDVGILTNWSLTINYNFGAIVWSPTTGLFTDALATVPYNGTGNATTIYAKPATTTTYTATAAAGSCSVSDNVTFTVNAVPTASIAGSTQSVIDGAIVTLAANNPSVGAGVWSIVSGPNTNDTQFANINSNSSVFNYTAVGTYVLRWTISNGVCTASTSDVSISIENVKWNGTTWNNTTGPTASLDAFIEGDYVSTTHGATINVKNLTVAATGSIVMASGGVLNVAGILTNNATVDDVVIQSGAYLNQTNTGTNVGSITVQRNAQIKRLDISLWSSPVASQILLALSPQTLVNRFFTYNETANNWAVVSNVSAHPMAVGTGYGVRAPNDWSLTTATFTGTFKGVPNNGNYTQAFTSNHATANYNAIGNPYPSVLDLRDFYNANDTKIRNTFYFFEHSVPSGTVGQTNYGTLVIAPDPADNVYTPASNSPNAASEANIESSESVEVGQGFFVRALAGQAGVLNFDNTMRKTTTSGVFFRNNVAQSNETSKFRLEMNTPEGFVNQAVVGYYDYASDDQDMMDAQGIGSPLYSLLGTQKLVVQGFGLPFNQGQVIPMGGNFAIEGNYSIGLKSAEGIFVNEQYILLHDNELGVYHNLSLSPYQFEALGGTNDTRFEIVFTSVLSNENPIEQGNNVIVYEANEVLQAQIKGNSLLESIKVIDLNGRLLFEEKGLNTTLFRLEKFNKTQTVVLISTQTTDGKTQTHKVFY